MAKKKKIKKIKKKVKRVSGPQKILFKIKPLERTKKVKIKKPPKPAKPLVKKPKPIKTVKPKKPKLIKPIESPIYKARIKVIGIGGGGSSIVSEIASEVKKVVFVVANTDFQALQGAAKEAKHFQFGKSLTQGLGTGMNPELGEQAAESDKKKIKELLKETDFCILVSCLGGGTGSGASPVFANTLKNLGILTLGIFTLPFEFEGGKRAQIAKDSLEKLRQNLNASVIIPNQKIFQIIDASTNSASTLSGNRRADKNTPLKEAFSTINKAVAESLEGLITLIYSSGLIHVDFATLKTILAGRGRLAYLNSVEAKSPNQIEELVKSILSNPLIPYSVQGAKEILFNIDGGLNLNMSQVEQIGKTISDSINPQARVAFGIAQDKKEGIKITLLANGCKWEEWEEKKERPEKKQILITKIQDYNPRTGVRRAWREALASRPATLPLKRVPVRNVFQEEEKKTLAQERKWETPAFLRRKLSQIEEKPGE